MSWKDTYNSKLSTAADAMQIIKSGDRIVLGQMHGISQILVDALCARKDDLMDVTVFSSFNLNREPYVEQDLRPNLTYLNGFLFPASRKAYREGRVEYLQLFFKDFPYWTKNIWKPTVAMPVLTPPDENGYCSFSMNADFMVAACEVADHIIAHVNPSAPRTFGAKLHVDQLTYAVEVDHPLTEIPMGSPGEVEEKIAAHIAERIQDGACLQLGIGGIPNTVLSLLKDKKDLGIHSEVFSDGVVELCEKGIINGARKQIDKYKLVTTCIMGTKHVHKFVDNNPNVLLMPVDYTNNPNIIAQNDNLVSINSCLEVDFMGQVNADYIKGSFFSGIGGQVDFIRGASMSKGGQSFITLPSTAINNTVSTIVPQLKSPVTTSRHDVQSIVTEYGVADLFGKSLKERAKALISIAHPDFREELTAEARKAKIL